MRKRDVFLFLCLIFVVVCCLAGYVSAEAIVPDLSEVVGLERMSAPESAKVLLQKNGTVSVAGTLIYSEAFGITGNQNNRTGGDTKRENEIILKQNTTYRFVIDSNTENSIVSWQGEWYELPVRNSAV